jgi:hypothetical protein
VVPRPPCESAEAIVSDFHLKRILLAPCVLACSWLRADDPADGGFTAEKRAYWCFQPLAKTAPSKTIQAGCAVTSTDSSSRSSVRYGSSLRPSLRTGCRRRRQRRSSFPRKRMPPGGFTEWTGMRDCRTHRRGVLSGLIRTRGTRLIVSRAIRSDEQAVFEEAGEVGCFLGEL